LATALSNIAAKGDAWIKAVEDFKMLRQNTFTHLENEIETFKRQREEVEQEFEHAKWNKKQELCEYGYQSALKILADRKEVAISEEELNRLTEKLHDLEQRGDYEVKRAVEEERMNAQRLMDFEKKTQQLQHEKEVATLTSQVEALTKQLSFTKEEIDFQRELCRSIAENFKQPAIIQNLSK